MVLTPFKIAVLGFTMFLVISVLAYGVLSRKNKKRRAGDRGRLKGHEKRNFLQAEVFRKKGDFINAAKILESINLKREAIDLLEKNNLIDEAANILKRNGHHHRAAELFSRHSRMKEASQCFERANLFDKAAAAANASGDFSRAMKLFELNNNYTGMANCYLELGELSKAATLFVKVGKPHKALKLYPTIVESVPDISLLSLSPEEVVVIKEAIISGELDASLGNILNKENLLAETVVELVKNNNINKAQDLFLKSTRDLGPQLIAMETLSLDETKQLAQLLEHSSSFKYAGILYERLELFIEAASAFGNGEDYERAAHCYERGNEKEKAREMRFKLAAHGPITPKDKPLSTNSDNPFVIGESTSSPGLPTTNAPEVAEVAEVAEDSTQVVEAASQSAFSLSTPPPSEPNNANVDNFHKSKFLKDLNFEEKNMLKEIAKELDFFAKSIILDIDAEPEGVYFLLEGKIRCLRKNGNKFVELDQITPPATIGEFWLLIEQPSSVRFEAIEDCKLLKIDRHSFHEVLDKNGAIARKIYKSFTKRLVRKLITPENKKGKAS